MPSSLARWFDDNILELGREMRLSYLPPLMVYVAAGISKAARDADMDRKYLHKLLRKYGITAQVDEDGEN